MARKTPKKHDPKPASGFRNLILPDNDQMWDNIRVLQGHYKAKDGREMSETDIVRTALRVAVLAVPPAHGGPEPEEILIPV